MVNKTVLLLHSLSCLKSDALILASSFLFANWSGKAGEVDDFLPFIFSSKLILRGMGGGKPYLNFRQKVTHLSQKTATKSLRFLFNMIKNQKNCI